jgi:hypothetical protein
MQHGPTKKMKTHSTAEMAAVDGLLSMAQALPKATAKAPLKAPRTKAAPNYAAIRHAPTSKAPTFKAPLSNKQKYDADGLHDEIEVALARVRGVLYADPSDNAIAEMWKLGRQQGVVSAYDWHKAVCKALLLLQPRIMDCMSDRSRIFSLALKICQAGSRRLYTIHAAEIAQLEIKIAAENAVIVKTEDTGIVKLEDTEIEQDARALLIASHRHRCACMNMSYLKAVNRTHDLGMLRLGLSLGTPPVPPWWMSKELIHFKAEESRKLIAYIQLIASGLPLRETFREVILVEKASLIAHKYLRAYYHVLRICKGTVQTKSTLPRSETEQTLWDEKVENMAMLAAQIDKMVKEPKGIKQWMGSKESSVDVFWAELPKNPRFFKFCKDVVAELITCL